MKKISVSVSYDEEKLSTLRLYLEQKRNAGRGRADQVAGYALCEERSRRRSRIFESALRQCGASRSESAEAESGAETYRGGDRS